MIDLTDDNFEEVLKENNESLNLIFFHSSTCGPCKTMAPVINKYDSVFNEVNVLSVKADESPYLSSMFGVRGVPALFFWKKEQVIHANVGVTPFATLEHITKSINSPEFEKTNVIPNQETPKQTWFYISIAVILAFFIGVLIAL